LVPNSVDWIVACFAIARAGCVSVPISCDATEPEIRYRLEDATCRAIVTGPGHLAMLRSMRVELSSLTHLIVAASSDVVTDATQDETSLATVLSAPQEPPRDPEAIDETAFIVYTSGTTGKAKGVALTQRSMLWVTAACWAPIARLNASDVVLSALPLFHSYALNFSALSVLAVGASEVLLERFSTQEVWAQLQTGRFTVMPGVPTMFHYLLEQHRNDPPRRLPGIRVCISAGAILPAALNREFEARFGVPLLDGYGITESSTMVTMNWPDAPRVMGSCGLPLPGLAVRLVSPLDGLDVPPGEEGELIVRGPNIMQGYVNKPEETASVLRDGWYHTGDLARSDANGFLTITGRLKELIIRGGQNIAPAEVEEALLQHPGVVDCAVIGIAHAHLGEVPVACVVARAGEQIDAEALRAHCARLLSSYKVPSIVHLVDAIPRTGSGKIMRFKLRDALAALGTKTNAPDSKESGALL
jgi:long-chain acyl-CoA synthetase